MSGRPRRRIARLGVCAAALLAPALVGCGRDTVVELADYAGYQRDQVTTRWVPAGSELAGRLASEGWRVEAEGPEPALAMTGARARIWFFSADGATTGVELHRRPGAGPDRLGSISYRVNDRPQGAERWPSDADVVTLPFGSGAARAGWNALDLQLRPDGPEPRSGALELSALRFYDPVEAPPRDQGPAELEVADGRLTMPAESLLRVAIEVPPRGRVELETTAQSSAPGSGTLDVALELLDPAGDLRELGAVALDPGETDRLTVDLGPWSGRPVELRLSVGGPRAAAVRFARAEILGAGEPQPAVAPIRPAGLTPSGRLGRPDVFVVLLDAARADAFGAYGAEHPTPAVDALAAAGTRFERAQAPSSWTGQSIPALLTGFHPDTLHTERWGDPLPEEVPALAELMAAAGYRTVLWSQHPIYRRTPSLERGFERTRYSGRRKRWRLPPATFLLERSRPTFALIHLLPPHSPYSPPAPFRGSYTEGYRGKLWPKLGALERFGGKRLVELSAEDHAYIRGRYLENVAFADHLVGRLVDALTAAGRYDQALILVTSDHGEAFFEHGHFAHSRELYQEFIRIPMVVKWPGSLGDPASVVESPVTLIDLVPTLVDGLGLSVGRGFQGATLLPAVLDRAPLERAIYATTRGLGDVDRTGKPRRMLEQGEWRVIHDPLAAGIELYAVHADPTESDDLAPARPALARLLLQRLLLQRAFNLGLLELGPRAATDLDPELVKELEALGYL